jgi:hypothetical protein
MSESNSKKQKNASLMLKVHIDVWKFYLPKLLDPRDLSRLSACCKRLRCLGESVHPNYKKSKNDALFRACKEGHRKLAEWLIDKKGANYFKWALRGACKGGHRELAQWLIDEKGANHFNFALYNACKGGHRKLAEWLINEKGANNLKWALRGACKGGHQELAEWLIFCSLWCV